jgi:hypothetical protein
VTKGSLDPCAKRTPRARRSGAERHHLDTRRAAARGVRSPFTTHRHPAMSNDVTSRPARAKRTVGGSWRAGATSSCWAPISKRIPASHGTARRPRSVEKAAVARLTSWTPISRPESRPGPPARTARSACCHSAESTACSIRNGGPSGERVSGSENHHRTVRPSGLTRVPGSGAVSCAPLA